MPAELWFEEVARQSGLVFDHQSTHDKRYLLPEINCGGGALFDMDGDGDLDAYLAQSGGGDAAPRRSQQNRLFRNRGDGSFEDRALAVCPRLPMAG